ncbi:MAG: hypothetical protein HY301_09090 [Verrucomicrobia bacterium]|nr:hypothetical protein [Verrucomicrobiota bacterium]
MIVADILMWFLLVVGLLLVFISYWLASVALFPRMAERARAAYAQPVRAVLLGVLIATPLITLGVVIGARNNPFFKVLGLTIGAVPVLLGLVGSAGLSLRIGAGMASPVDDAQPWRRALRGGIVLSLGFLLPFLGWFGVLPLTLLSGVGAAVRAMWKGRAPSAPPPLAEVELSGARQTA